ncbi:MAG TPA: DUF4250 domain-containing protein [Candidatus Merdenecus merdavium]|nr:DUF4250 domain-containing protein [Candidatus Merdenecus merdavium]
MLPEDPAILLSYVNMQLRDYYTSLEDLCKSLSVSKEYIVQRLESIQYEYDPNLNQFI